MSSQRISKSETSVKARLHQFESAVASADHFSKHPDQLRQRREKGSLTSGNDSDEDSDSESFEFADLVKALTLDSTSSGEQDALREAFKILDCDEDGFITLHDLREAMRGFEEDEEEGEGMSDEDLVDMIAAADDKGNGRISFESFVRILEPKKKKKEKEDKGKSGRSRRT